MAPSDKPMGAEEMADIILYVQCPPDSDGTCRPSNVTCSECYLRFARAWLRAHLQEAARRAQIAAPETQDPREYVLDYAAEVCGEEDSDV